MFAMCTAGLNACMLRYHDGTEQWRHDQVGWCPLPNITEFIILSNLSFFSENDLMNDDSSFLHGKNRDWALEILLYCIVLYSVCQFF